MIAPLAKDSATVTVLKALLLSAAVVLSLWSLATPPGLLAACPRAMVDEVRHAELTFALASAHAGQPLDPGPMPALAPRGGGLVAVARDTFLEGCVAETSAVLRAQRALATAEDPAVRAALTRIVRDETRHAELAWQTVAWCIAEGGAEVLEAVRAAAQAQDHTPQAWQDVIAPSLALIDPVGA